jgi:hypothetical protein
LPSNTSAALMALTTKAADFRDFLQERVATLI